MLARARARARVCVCVCVCVRARVRACNFHSVESRITEFVINEATITYRKLVFC